MKLLLISPLKDSPGIKRIKIGINPPYNLLILASLTPPDVEIQVIDELYEDINFDIDVDLVGITVMTPVAPRAYWISEEFRKRGKKVILGGMHVSAMPEEALQHADAICISEAEEYWKDVIEDFKNDNLKKIYAPKVLPEVLRIPAPAYHLVKGKRYFFPYITQTARGCPYACSFCSVSHFFGRRYRFRPIEDVINELKNLKGKFIAFADDNITANKERAKKLFSSILPLKLKWFSQGSVEMSEDDELLTLAKKSGCKAIFIGFESISDNCLNEIGKFVNLRTKYENAIKKIHSYKISIIGAFIFGFDNDNETIIKKTVDFAKKVKLEVAQFGILTPLPGTDLFKKLIKEKRIFDFNWRKYDVAHVVFKPKNLSPEVLQEKFNWSYRSFYSLSSILKRINIFSYYKLKLLPVNLAFKNYFYGGKKYLKSLTVLGEMK